MPQACVFIYQASLEHSVNLMVYSGGLGARLLLTDVNFLAKAI
jgi:hypothetical protein